MPAAAAPLDLSKSPSYSYTATVTERNVVLEPSINPKTSVFDYEKFAAAIDVIKEHQGIDNYNKLADQIGIGHGSLYRMSRGEGFDLNAMVKIIAWSKLDLRNYIVDAGVAAGDPVRPQLTD